MHDTFAMVHRHVGKAAIVLMWLAVAFFLLTLGSALLGFSHLAIGFRTVSLALAIGFALTVIPFVVMSVARAAIRRIDRRQT